MFLRVCVLVFVWNIYIYMQLCAPQLNYYASRAQLTLNTCCCYCGCGCSVFPRVTRARIFARSYMLYAQCILCVYVPLTSYVFVLCTCDIAPHPKCYAVLCALRNGSIPLFTWAVPNRVYNMLQYDVYYAVRCCLFLYASPSDGSTSSRESQRDDDDDDPMSCVCINALRYRVIINRWHTLPVRRIFVGMRICQYLIASFVVWCDVHIYIYRYRTLLRKCHTVFDESVEFFRAHEIVRRLSEVFGFIHSEWNARRHTQANKTLCKVESACCKCSILCRGVNCKVSQFVVKGDRL